MKIALVQDGLMCRAGGEQVALCFHKAFPDAPIFTQCYQPLLTFPEFKECDVRTTWLQKIAKTDGLMKKLFFPLGIWAMQSHDLSDFDVVLMSSTNCAKYVKLSPNTLVINYCHAPFRLAWEPTSYAQYANSSWLVRKGFDVVLSLIRKLDFRSAQRPDYYLCNTEEMAQKVRCFYATKVPVLVIPPPVNVSNFHVSNELKPYFLVVSRLEFYKKVDIVVSAFNQLGYPLIVVGKGVKGQDIKLMANENVTFLSDLSKEELAKIYANCRALIFPQHEDYGITPLEANASGRPIIAFKAGGVLSTQVVSSTDISKSTALFFESQTVESLVDAVNRFEKIEGEFDPNFIRIHAENFDEPAFIRQIKQFVVDKYEVLRVVKASS